MPYHPWHWIWFGHRCFPSNWYYITDLGKLKLCFYFFQYLNLSYSSFFHLPSGFLDLLRFVIWCGRLSLHEKTFLKAFCILLHKLMFYCLAELLQVVVIWGFFSMVEIHKPSFISPSFLFTWKHLKPKESRVAFF